MVPSEPSAASALRSYFRSGWAFLVPYLAVYLLYAALKWPVNPAASRMDGGGIGLPGIAAAVPSLLHLYWALHAIHLVFGVFALRSWWRDGKGDFSPALLASLIPWICLALLFWIPGIYLEWPSDPWEHLRRINEWHFHGTVTAHSSWRKSSYFLPYSLTGHTTGLVQLGWLNFYYTAACLLLSWQYYRLARAIGFGEKAALTFVLLNALTFGNNIFSFFRYYGLSSSILAQIGAVALTYAAVEAAKATIARETTGEQRHYLHHVRSILSPCLSGITLCVLIAFNHIQGLGIASLGLGAVLLWRIVQWRRTMIGWIALATLLASIAMILWFPRHLALDEIYRPQGWLTAWYGFDLFSPKSPALARSLHIFGTLGIANVFLGLWLVARRNDLAGWLTLMPLVVLALPCFALPFASLLASEKSVENIVTFHRMLFAVPLPLAMVAAGANLRPTGRRSTPGTKAPPSSFLVPVLKALRRVAPFTLPIALFSVLVLSPGHHSFNRFWQAIQVTPKDLQLDPYVAISAPAGPEEHAIGDTLVVESPLVTDVRDAFEPSLADNLFRKIHQAPSAVEIASRIDEFANALSNPAFRASPSIIGRGNLHSDVLVRLANPSAAKEKHVVADLTAIDLRWVSLGGETPRSYPQAGKLMLSNSPGKVSYAFNSEMIPVELSKRYLLSAMIRQTRGAGRNYLAVAWYDRAGRLLVSNEPKPIGAGHPAGWVAGIYSYYGLVNQHAGSEWTRYTITFGLGEPAEIPHNAAYLRVGALLNEKAAPNSSAEFTDVILWEKPVYRQIHLAAPDSRSLFTPGSQAGWLSGHWLPHYLAAQQMGVEELRSLFLRPPPAVPVNPVSD